jgi:hypothetical protein
MAMNLEAVLRIAAKVVGVEEISKLEKGITGAEKAAGDASAAFKGVANSAIWQAAAAGAAVFTAGMGLAVKAAIDFESSMSDVRKVVSGIETPEAFAEISNEIMNLSNTMPIAAKGFAEIYAAAGQSGIARDQLKEFAVLVAQVSVAFDMTAQEAGQSLAQMKVALGLTTEELRDLADAMNYVSNNTGATAANLVEFMSRSGAVGKIAGLSATETMAFGAAMIQAGIQTEVASTSFNNMVKALSRGPSMTERQVAALRNLGYSMADAAKVESELTRAAETESRRRVDDARRHKDDILRLAQDQSDRRIEIARDETDRLSKEINRRYRDELQSLQDGWEDQAKAQEDAFRDRADAQIKALQRQERAEIDSIQKVAQAQGGDASAAVDRIRDAYESRIDAVRDQLDRELTVQRRAQRNQQQIVRDSLDDRKDLELKANSERFKLVEKQEESFMAGQTAAAENRFKAIEEAEKSFVENAKASAKKTGEELAKASTQGFADRMQEDAIGTITEVLGKIRDLPKSQQISVLSDLFGDEARGLAPMIANLDELTRILGLAADETGRADSVSKEYGIRVATAAAQLQLFWNQLQNTATLIGTTVLPYLAKAAEALKPIIQAVANFAKNHPEITALAVAFGAVATGLILVAPVIAGFISAIATIKGVLAGGAIVAALKTFVGAFGFAISKGLIPLFTGLLSWLWTTLVPGIVAVFSGPIGWTVLAVAAVVAMAIAFREPLMQFAAWLWDWTEFARAPFVRLWNAVATIVTTSLDVLAKAITAWGGEIVKIWTGDFSTLQNIVESWADTVQAIWTAIAEAFTDYLVTPIRDAWTGLSDWLSDSVEAIRTMALGAWTAMAEGLRNAFRGVLQFIADRINQVGRLINVLIDGFNRVSATVNGPQIRRVPVVPVPAFAEGGIVDRPTLALVGEGGEREYIIPASKMEAASSRFLSGARGADVIPSRASSRSESGSASPQINITTGPVMQQQDGSQWVSMDDYERGLQQVTEQIVGALRTPQARVALGW